MTKRTAIGGGLLLAGLLAGGFWIVRQEREPVWRGKRYSEWLEEYAETPHVLPPHGSSEWVAYLERREAIKEIGTNGIPLLLKMLVTKDGGLKEQLARLDGKQRLTRWEYRDASQLRDAAFKAFGLLGASASNAVPQLIDLLRKGDSEEAEIAAVTLGLIGRPAQEAVVGLFGEFGDTNDPLRFYSESISYGKWDDEVLVPALTSLVDHLRMVVRRNAIVSLQFYGRRAQGAVPKLLATWEAASAAGNEKFVQLIEEALWNVAPEKTPKVLVVEEVGEWVQGGVMEVSIDMQIGKERKTLIPAGSRIPFSRQCWTSDPRGPIRLYRSGGDSPEEEEFVGEFEIVGLPEEPDEVHAYAVVGIADGNLFLCARDVKLRRLLEVRRVK